MGIHITHMLILCTYTERIVELSRANPPGMAVIQSTQNGEGFTHDLHFELYRLQLVLGGCGFIVGLVEKRRHVVDVTNNL